MIPPKFVYEERFLRTKLLVPKRARFGALGQTTFRSEKCTGGELKQKKQKKRATDFFCFFISPLWNGFLCELYTLFLFLVFSLPSAQKTWVQLQFRGPKNTNGVRDTPMHGWQENTAGIAAKAGTMGIMPKSLTLCLLIANDEEGTSPSAPFQSQLLGTPLWKEQPRVNQPLVTAAKLRCFPSVWGCQAAKHTHRKKKTTILISGWFCSFLCSKRLEKFCRRVGWRRKNAVLARRETGHRNSIWRRSGFARRLFPTAGLNWVPFAALG